ncbi:MAG: ABC transporter substrate-binding protein [Ruminococcus flavefaciens]|nr:ABC transporter substrate-binding protein [Ruminococcus flavefaciens]
MGIKKSFALLALGMCVFVLSACGGKEKEDDVPMGRYTEREVILPGTGYEYMHPLADGGYYLQGNDVDFTRVDAEGEIQKTAWLWEKNYNVREKEAYGISDTGAVIFAFVPQIYSQEELAVIGTEEEVRYKYYYVDEKGERHLVEMYGDDYSPTETFEEFAFAPDGRLYGATYERICRIDPTTGEVESLFQTEQSVYRMVFIEDILVAADGMKFYLYDMTDDKLLSDNAVLNEFVQSHDAGRLVLAPGHGTDMVTLMEPDAAETDAGDRPVLYIGCRTGLYRYIWGGSMIEQIADGQMLTLGNTQYTPIALQALANGEFRMLFSSNYMVELYYDETIPARPSKELVVYSLEENDAIRYAGQLFQKKRPDVLVTYETGMYGDYAVSKEDAVKNLNTRLLAGECPDVMILDGLDIEQYAEKGMLRELDDYLASYREEDSLYFGIVEGMRMTESEKIYGVPLKVFVPLYLSETKYLDGQTDLSALVSGVEKARQEHPTGPIIQTAYPKDLLNALFPVCLPAWTTGDGKLDTVRITEFYQTAKTLWNLDNAGMDETARAQWQEETGLEEETPDLYAIDIPFNSSWISWDNGPETWIEFGYTQDAFMGMRSVHLRYFGFREGGGYRLFKELDDVNAFGFGKYGGQAQDVYWGRCIVGLCEKAKEPELAEDFLALLLSDEMMRKWWLEDGYPIRKESMEKILDIDNHEWAEVQGASSASVNIWYAQDAWPTEEEKQWMYRILEEASTPFLSGSVLEETAREIGLRVLAGELTPEEGAEQVARKMAIEMEE